MTIDIEGVGATTEVRGEPIDHSRPPHWIRVYRVDKRHERIACLRCVESQTMQIVDRDIDLVIRDLEHFQKVHWLCSGQTRAVAT